MLYIYIHSSKNTLLEIVLFESIISKIARNEDSSNKAENYRIQNLKMYLEASERGCKNIKMNKYLSLPFEYLNMINIYLFLLNFKTK